MTTALAFILSITGTWQYAGFRYDGHFYENPSPGLVLTFTFYPDHTSRLYWYRDNEPGFCERRAEYRLEKGRIWQKTTWVNPANDISCANDPEMQNGKQTTTPYILSGDELTFVLNLDGRDLLYILRPPQSVPAQKHELRRIVPIYTR